MGTLSTAVGVERQSRTTGFNIKKGNFSTATQNLPQIIAIFAEANSANQVGLTTAKREVTSAAEAGELYGYGSPIHRILSILRPISGDGVGGIPTVVFPQISDESATPTVKTFTVTGTAFSNGTCLITINGRTSIDFQSYSFNIVKTDTPTIVAAKIADAINGVLGSPCTATHSSGVVTITTKWAGLTSKQLDVRFTPKASGITIASTSITDGAGDVDLAESFAQFGDTWYTMVVNGYDVAQLEALEEFNGLPNDTDPTGRYGGLIFKPFNAYFGNTSADKDVLSAITDDADRIAQVTNVLCPAPNSKGFLFEAAANVVALASVTFQQTPNIDVSGFSYPDMPTPSNDEIGDMTDYNNRDFLVKKGCSTVMLVNGSYQIQDLVTTYHPQGEIPLLYQYPRTLNIHFNVKDSYSTLEKLYLKDKTIVSDTQLVEADNCIKPKEWKGIVFSLFDELATEALINDPQFSKDSLQVQIGETNPNRFETTFNYKTTGTVRISSTTAKAGF